MNARYLAALLSLCVLSIPVHANSSPVIPPEKTITVSDKININSADLSTLTGSYKGIGKKRAEAIIAYRESHHGFKSLEELADVRGLGQHFVDVNREKLKEVFVVG
jgi:competence protein ComEA